MANQKGYLFLTGFSGLTHTDIANFTGKTLNSTEQSVIDDLISSAEDYVARQCQRNFFYSTGGQSPADQIYFEVTDADIDEFYPFSFPIKEVTQIDIAGVTVYQKGGSSNQITPGTDFFVYPEKIEFINKNYTYNIYKQAMTIYYSIDQFWGKDVTLAIKRWVSETFLASQYGGKGISSVNISGGLTVRFDTANLPKYISDLINYYKKIKLTASGGFKKGSQVGLHDKGNLNGL